MLGNIAIACVVIIFAAMFVANVVGFAKAWVEQRKAKLFSKFVNGLAGENGDENLVNQVFSGEVQLEQIVYIILPESFEIPELERRFSAPIAAELSRLGLGEVVRHYSVADTSGIDVQLNDFVDGIAAIRQILIRADAPQETLIEYPEGELEIYDV